VSSVVTFKNHIHSDISWLCFDSKNKGTSKTEFDMATYFNRACNAAIDTRKVNLNATDFCTKEAFISILY